MSLQKRVQKKKVSIVMTAYNRKDQLRFTLETISNSIYLNLEIIVVDDASDEHERFDTEDRRTDYENKLYYELDVKVIRINKEDKTWINPCMSYNIGIKEATGDIIIIQNSEVCHIGDCILYVVNNLEKGDWLSLNCYGLGGFDQNSSLIFNFFTKTSSIYDYINTIHRDISSPIGGSVLFNDNPQGWLNHHRDFFTAYHYFGAIYREDLITKMDGGFCEEYKNGICLDDNDFIKYLIHTGFRFTTTQFRKDIPFVVHQYHRKCINLGDKFEHYHNINKHVFTNRMNKIRASLIIDIKVENYMPEPHLLC